jgi:hypothetical protein
MQNHGRMEERDRYPMWHPVDNGICSVSPRYLGCRVSPYPLGGEEARECLAGRWRPDSEYSEVLYFDRKIGRKSLGNWTGYIKVRQCI